MEQVVVFTWSVATLLSSIMSFIPTGAQRIANLHTTMPAQGLVWLIFNKPKLICLLSMSLLLIQLCACV